MIYQFQGKYPEIHPSVFVAAGAQIIGDVVIGKDSNIWFNAVLRGDVNSIRIGEGTNIQDGCVLHVTNGNSPLIIGSNVTVGHGATLHSCVVLDCSLIGMGAIVLDNARVGSYTLVAAGALVREGMEIPEGVLVAGVPAKIIRELTAEERQRLAESALGYVEHARLYHTANNSVSVP